VADRPLRPATRLRLGEPLPHQLPDRPRDHPPAADFSSTDHAIQREYPVLIQVSLGYPGLGGRFLTCYAPVRRFPRRNLTEPTLLPRLACIKRAANVRPEPGSNSPSKSDGNDPVSTRWWTRSLFIPQKDAITRRTGVLLMCDRGLYDHRSFRDTGEPARGRSDGRCYACPSTAQLFGFVASACQSRSSAFRRTIDALFSCQGARILRGRLPTLTQGPHSVPSLRASDDRRSQPAEAERYTTTRVSATRSAPHRYGSDVPDSQSWHDH
jgi:hypothetical protein